MTLTPYDNSYMQVRTPRFEPTPALPAKVRTLVDWAKEAQAAYELAKMLVGTPFAGPYSRNPDGAAAAILKGSELGLTPVTALSAFDLIQGVPAPRAMTLRALLQSHGHTVWIESSTDTQCVAKGRRKGESIEHTSTWTIKRATDLGLTSKPNWKNQAKAMLMARATGEVCRLTAADVILGIGYTSEEVADEQPEPTARVSRPSAASPSSGAGTRRVQRTEPEAPPLPAVTPAAELTSGPEDDSGAEPMSTAQSRALHAALRDRGLGDRDDGLAWISQQLGREVTTTKDLTAVHASVLLDDLHDDSLWAPRETAEADDDR